MMLVACVRHIEVKSHGKVRCLTCMCSAPSRWSMSLGILSDVHAYDGSVEIKFGGTFSNGI